jgi:glutamate dehydrogenase
MRTLEKAGKLNRAVEFLPPEDEIAERHTAKKGLTPPERAVLLAYSKMVLSDELVAAQALVDDDYVSSALVGYFPVLLQKRYADVMPRHPLRRDIIATVVANTMINRTGSVFVSRMQDETGASPEEVTRAFILTRDIFGLESLWLEIDALDNKVPAQLQYEMLIDVGRLVVRSALWFLRRRREKLPIAEVIAIFKPGVAALRNQVPAILAASDRLAFDKSVERLTSQGVPADLAARYAGLEGLYAVLDSTEVSVEQKKTMEEIGGLYFTLVGELDLRWVAEKITQLPTDTSWQALARNALRDDLAVQQRTLTSAVSKLSPEGQDPAAMLAEWKDRYAPALTRLKSMTDELKRGGVIDLAVLSVLLRELRALA